MDPVMKIIVDVERQEKMIALKEEVGKLTQQVIAGNAAMKAQGMTTAQIATAMAPLGQQISRAAVEFKGLETASGKAGYGLLNLGYAIDDVQYGFSSIVNNIPQIAMAIGGPHAMAIAGAAGVAAVAVNQLIKHWGDMATALEANWSGKSIEQLEKIKETAEAAAKALEKIPEFTEAQGRQAAGVGKMVQEGPKKEFIADLMHAIQENPKERVERGIEADGLGPLRKESDKEWAARVRKKAEKMLGEALLPGEEGDLASRKIGELLPGRKAQLEALSPAGQKRDADAQKNEERKKREAETDESNRKEQEKMFAEQGLATERAQKEGDALRKSDQAAAAAKKHDDDEARKSIKETLDFQKKARGEQLRHRIESLEDERKALMESSQRIQKEMHGPQQSAGGSLRSGLEAMSQRIFDQIPKDQLKNLEEINKGIKELDKTIKDERRGAAKFS